MDINEVKEIIEEIYSECGDYLCLDRAINESWDDAFGRMFPDLSKVCVEVFKDYLKKHDWDLDMGVEISTEDFAWALCDKYEYQIDDWESDNVFDSPGLDVYVLSFVLSNGLSNDSVYSFNNVFYRN
jgi:hypothetical protein